jgi:hypothetical protein
LKRMEEQGESMLQAKMLEDKVDDKDGKMMG